MSRKKGTREAILAAPDLREETVEVPEWDCTVTIRALTLGQRNRAFKLASDKAGNINTTQAAAFMFVLGVVDPKFNESDADDLAKKNVGVIDKVNARILALSGLSKDSVEEAIKNSEATPAGDSSI